MVPALNAYGRYIQSTGFGALDPDVMRHTLPLVYRESITARSTGKLNRLSPNEKITSANLSLNLVGVLNKYVSYRFEQTLYSNNLGGGNTGHFWVAYNGLFNGNGHLLVGKFDAPAPPAFSYWSDMSGFSSGGMTVGQHTYNISGSRWGVGLNYVPTNYEHMPYKLQMAYVGNSPPMYNGSVWSSSNPYADHQNGSDKAFQYKLAWARPDNPVEGGVYGAFGTYILGSGYTDPIDRYNALGFYVQRDPVRGVPGMMLFYQRTNDSNVGPGKAGQHLTQSASGWSYAFELDESLANGNVMLGFRPVEYVSGLVPSKSGYDVVRTAHPHYGVFDIALRDPKISPYLYLTAESALGAASNAQFGIPTWRMAIRWAAPIGGPAAP